jgi:N-acetyl-gamma-glutamyl-phosphate reductase
MPLLGSGLIDASDIIADCKSGVSGAGRKANLGTLLCEASECLKAYAVAGHRHLPEIVQGLQEMSGMPVGLTFVPHLTPMIRGIHATLYAKAKDPNLEKLQELYTLHYQNEPFVDVLPEGSHPETRSVRGANTCRIAIHRPQQGNTLVVLSVIDNLVKGAAGQAVQNMNIMFGLEETMGLNSIAIMP